MELALVQIVKAGQRGSLLSKYCRTSVIRVKEYRDLGGGAEWQGIWQDMMSLRKGIRTPQHLQQPIDEKPTSTKEQQ